MIFPPFPDKTYDFILADPPWFYQNWSDRKNGAARSWYDCLKVEELCKLPVGDLANDNCALFMWITGPKLIEGSHIPIMEAWGFRPVTIAFVWNKTYRSGKPYMGLGFYTRQSVEYCLLGLKGKFARESKSVLQHFEAPRTIHSQKPEGFHLKIEELFGKKKGIELFARNEPTCSDAWDVWGNQIQAKEEVAADMKKKREYLLGRGLHNPNWVDSLNDERKKTYE